MQGTLHDVERVAPAWRPFRCRSLGLTLCRVCQKLLCCLLILGFFNAPALLSHFVVVKSAEAESVKETNCTDLSKAGPAAGHANGGHDHSAPVRGRDHQECVLLACNCYASCCCLIVNANLAMPRWMHFLAPLPGRTILSQLPLQLLSPDLRSLIPPPQFGS